MTMPDVSGLPENIDATYVDKSAGDQAHQQHHDLLHRAAKALLPREEASSTYERLARINVAFNAYGFNLVGDAIELDDISVAAGGNTITSPSASFSEADIGKGVALAQAGTSGGALSSSPSGQLRTISEVIDANTVRFTDPAGGVAVTSVVGPRTVAGDIARGSQTFTSAGAAFTASDKGKTIVITGAYGRALPVSRTPSASMAAGSAVLTSVSSVFVASHVGRYVKVPRAGVSGAPLVAKIVSRASATQVTLDTAATGAVSDVEVFDLGAPADFTTRITSVVSSTQVTVRRAADFTVTAASAAISGGSMVYGTNNSAALASLLAAVPATSTLFFPVGQFLLALGTTTLNRSGMTFEGAGRGLSIIHTGTGTRLTVGAHDVTLRRMGLRTLATDASAVFSLSVGTAYNNWTFEDVWFHRTAGRFERPGYVTNAGATVTNGTGHGRGLKLREVLATDAQNSGFVINAVEDVEIDGLRAEHCGRVAGDCGLKVAACNRPRMHRVTTCLNVADGTDLFDAHAPELVDFLSYMNGIGGLEEKWNSTNNYNNPERIILTNVEGSHNWSHGLVLSQNSMLGSALRAVGNGGDGIKTNDGATGTAVAARRSSLVAFESSGNGGSGLVNQARDLTLAHGNCHGNGSSGVSNNATSGTVLTNVRAFGNTDGIFHASVVADVRQDGCATQDANGQYRAAGTTSRVLANNYGEEAAGSGSQPTLANWPVGALVQNSSDGTFWRRTLTTWAAGTAA